MDAQKVIKQKAVSHQPWTVHPEIHQGIQGTESGLWMTSEVEALWKAEEQWVLTEPPCPARTVALIITKAFPKLPTAAHGASRGLPSTEAARPH